MANAPRNILGVLERLESPDVKVRQMRCIDVRNRNAGCHACADACTSGAISLVDGLISVDAPLCIGCGTCATVCPTSALESLNPDDAALLDRCLAAARANEGELVVQCAKAADELFGHYDEDRVVCVTCLGRIDESLVGSVATQGCESVKLVKHACEGCVHRTGAAVAEQVCASATELLEAWGHPIAIELVEGLPESLVHDAFDPYGDAAGDGEPLQDEQPPRQSDSAPLAENGADAPVAGENPADTPRATPEKVGRDGTLAHHLPTRRGQLLKALGTLGEPAEVTVSSRLWGTVSIDTDKCGSCRLCAVFCPTGALHKFDDRATGTFGIDHTPANCVQCRCCERVCPQGAVSVSSEIYAPDIADGHVERFEMRPQEIVPGKPTTVVKKMRKLLVGSQYVNFA